MLPLLSFSAQTAVVAAPAAGGRGEASSSLHSSGKGKQPGAATAASAVGYGAPKCKSKALYDLCTAANAEAYCDATGFHCNFMASCKDVCWCE